jgi:hypothetical protein
MSEAGPSPRLHRWLFHFTLGMTAALVSLVVVAPCLPRETLSQGGLGRILATFARDAVVRRTSLGAAVGLLVTAFVFFRKPQPQSSLAPSSRAISEKRKTR